MYTGAVKQWAWGLGEKRHIVQRKSRLYYIFLNSMNEFPKSTFFKFYNISLINIF